MPDEIILLSERINTDPLVRMLLDANPLLGISHADTLGKLRRAIDPGRRQRLISYHSGVIVPADILDAVGPAYNFHPGPPTRPGLFPATWALYEGDARFGATVHEMTPRVDDGPIVGVGWFDIEPDMSILEVDAITHDLMRDLFRQLAPLFANADGRLDPIDIRWSGARTTRADYNRLLNLPSDVDEEEFNRRLRAVGIGPEHALHFTLHGRKFRMEVDEMGDVVIGGERVDIK
jgi:methionyl-tRNA formyltransferase